jgi:hypothetical protein
LAATAPASSRRRGPSDLDLALEDVDAAADFDLDFDPPDVETWIGPLCFPCVVCRRGAIAVFERGSSARGRTGTCPACAGTGQVTVARSRAGS